MTRVLIDGLAIAALCLTALFAPPARAEGGGDLLSLLLGVGTVYAIGKGIEQARAPEPLPAADVSWAPRRTVPRECLATFETWHGELRGFESRCLDRRMRNVHRLPASCAIETRVGRRDTTVYSARCLQLEGWSIGGPRDDWRAGPGHFGQAKGRP